MTVNGVTKKHLKVPDVDEKFFGDAGIVNVKPLRVWVMRVSLESGCRKPVFEVAERLVVFHVL